MKTYVCGGLGFVGSHLVDRLLAYGHHVTIIDNLSRGRNFPILDTGWKLCLQDLTQHCPDFDSYSVVFHLAAKVTGIQYNRLHHTQMFMENDAINYHVFEAVRRSNPMLFINTSTVCVYPHDAPVPTPESAGDTGNAEPSNRGYGNAKWVWEQAAQFLCLEHNIPTIIVRPSNMIGQHDHYDPESSHVVPALIKRVVDGENPVRVWGSGNQTRSFLDAKDMARAYTELMEWGLKNRPRPAVTVNVGHAREITIRHLVETIVRLCGAEGREIEFDTSMPDGYPRRGSDVSYLKSLIGWVPDRPLEDTLREMIAEYRESFKQV